MCEANGAICCILVHALVWFDLASGQSDLRIHKFNVKHSVEQGCKVAVWADCEHGSLGVPVGIGIRISDSKRGKSPPGAKVVFTVLSKDKKANTNKRETTSMPKWVRLALEKGYYEIDHDQNGDYIVSKVKYTGNSDSWEVIVPDPLAIFAPLGGKALDYGAYLINVEVRFEDGRLAAVSGIPFEVIERK